MASLLAQEFERLKESGHLKPGALGPLAGKCERTGHYWFGRPETIPLAGARALLHAPIPFRVKDSILDYLCNGSGYLCVDLGAQCDADHDGEETVRDCVPLTTEGIREQTKVLDLLMGGLNDKLTPNELTPDEAAPVLNALNQIVRDAYRARELVARNVVERKPCRKPLAVAGN